MTKAKVKFGYETEKLFYLVPQSKHYYLPDFILPNGIMIECKGKLDSDGRKKMSLIKQQYPELDIRLLFMRDQPLYKGSPTLYSEWADKLGYKYAVGEIPEEWLV